MTQWIEMLIGMADGPTTPVRGTVKPYHRISEPVTSYDATYGEEPVTIPLSTDGVRLTRWRRRARIESLDGTVLFLSDGETVWNFTGDPQRPRCTTVGRARRYGPGRALVVTRPITDWVGDHHARPIGSVTDLEVLGRPCWSVELAPRPSINMPEPSLVLVVDAESGAVIAQHAGDGRSGAAYTDLGVGAAVTEADFRWDGPVETDEESRAKKTGRTPSDDERGLNWFRDNVATGSIDIPVRFDLTPSWVEVPEKDTGEFVAALGPPERRRTGRLMRRRRSPEPWAVKYPEEQRAWSTPDFDWMCSVTAGRIDDAGLATLQQRLHPGVPVTGAPELVAPLATSW